MSTPVLAALRQPGRVDFIDVSQVQGDIDFNAVREAGFEAVVVKASEGLRYCDPRGASNLARARDADLLAAAYAFARPSQGDPRAQARRLWDCVGDVAVGRLVLDLETRPDGWSDRQVIDFAEEYADEQAQLDGGSVPWVYTYESFALGLGPALYASSLGRCPLWLARYRSITTPWAPGPQDVPFVPQPWPRLTAWQYSGNGGFRVPGIVGDVDRNVFFGGLDELRAAFGLPSAGRWPGEGLGPVVRPAVPLGRPALDDE